VGGFCQASASFKDHVKSFAEEWDIPKWTTDMAEAINDPETDVDHFLRTGLELFTAVGPKGYVSEKAEGETGWLFPVGDEVHELGYPDMFTDMLNALDSGQEPMENFYDGYVVNAIMDACYRSAKSKKWEKVALEE
jgi:predicted dehydrogenase